MRTSGDKKERFPIKNDEESIITLSVSRYIPLNVIMKASGHTQIKTLNSYVEAVMDKNEFRKLSFKE